MSGNQTSDLKKMEHQNKERRLKNRNIDIIMDGRKPVLRTGIQKAHHIEGPPRRSDIMSKTINARTTTPII